MVQATRSTNTTQRSYRHGIAVLASDHDPTLVIGVGPDLMRAALAHEAPAGILQHVPHVSVLLRHRLRLVTRADGSGAPPAETPLKDFRADARIRGNILATSIPPNVSDASEQPDDSNDLDAGPPIYAARLRLRPCGEHSPWRFESSRAHRVMSQDIGDRCLKTSETLDPG